MSACDKCKKEVSKWNDATWWESAYKNEPAVVLVCHSRHLFPTSDCEGSPSRVRMIGMNPKAAAAFTAMASEQFDDVKYHAEADRNGYMGAEERIKELENEIRKMLWMGHGHQGIYGDDGEMQCTECLEVGLHHWDWKRAPLALLREQYAWAVAMKAKNVSEPILFLRNEYSELGARGCPACHYDDGKFIKRCKLHEIIDAKDAEIEQLVWNLGGCETYALGYDLDKEPDPGMARSALLTVRKKILELQASIDELRIGRAKK
ncbi:hypothetical protein IID24_03200 [Patescibacteria group bacterium]|nr:hypothetical protein [Patescibacteria group bacterium]